MLYPLTMMARSLALPILVVLLAVLALPWAQSHDNYPVLLRSVPVVSAVAVLGIGIIFNQLRACLIAIWILVAFWLLLNYAPARSADTDPIALLAYTWLVPINIVLLACMQEVGVFNLRSLMILLAMILQVALLISVDWAAPEVLPMAAQQWRVFAERTALPGELTVFFAAAFCLAANLWRHPTVLNAGLLLLMPALSASYYWRALPDAPQLGMSAAAGILLLGVLLETQRVAYRDDLTGLPSRRALNLRLAAPGRRYVIAMLDVDHFKNFNDRHGHDVGDQVLRVVARQLQTVRGGTAYRYGGEEFALVFPGRAMDLVLPRLEAVRQSIADYRIVLRNRNRPQQKPKMPLRSGAKCQRVKVTISIGVAERSPLLRSPSEVIKAADKALYKAKKAGRNRISV